MHRETKLTSPVTKVSCARQPLFCRAEKPSTRLCFDTFRDRMLSAMLYLVKCDSTEYHDTTLFQITGYAKSHLTVLSQRGNGLPKKRSSAHHTCFVRFPLFPLAYFLPIPLHLPFSLRNSFHSLLYSGMLLASGALYSNLFHMLIILCVKEFCLFFFLLVPNFPIFRSYLLLLCSQSVKSLLGSILPIHLKISKVKLGCAQCPADNLLSPLLL